MDASTIREQQLIGRYLMGSLSTREAQDFERWCRDNPETIAALGMQDRINAALRLLDASGEPLPWTTKPQAAWQKLPVFVAAVALAALGALASIALYATNSSQRSRMDSLSNELVQRPLPAIQATRAVAVPVSRDGPPASSSVSLSGARAELADLRFDVSWSRYAQFVVTIDRVQHGRFAVVSNLARDSNGHLRIGVNSAALGPGDYTVRIEGLDMRRGTEDQGHARFSISR